MRRKRKNNRIQNVLFIVICLLAGLIGGRYLQNPKQIVSLDDIPAYSDEPYVEINDNEPYFTDIDWSQQTYEYYSDLDKLGRAGYCEAYIDENMFPTEKRGSIGMVKPSGWHTIRYDDLIRDRYLYNRCHLIAYELTGQNANRKNLITGTRYMNVTGMLPWENKVHDYIRDTGNRVLYRVTPVYDGDDLVAKGVLMEAESEDQQLEFCVYCYNVQPGIVINYADGSSHAE